MAQAIKNEQQGPGKVVKDGILYDFVKTQHFDSPLGMGTLKGFFGRAEESDPLAIGIIRLGLIWGQASDLLSLSSANETIQDHYDYSGVADNDDLQSLQSEAARQTEENVQIRKQLKDLQESQNAKLEPKNNLPQELHGVKVNILHQGSFLAIDMDSGKSM